MPPAESGQHVRISRPRPSLSCLGCRRRKVRCGREQPACGNCVRIKENCEYEIDIQRPTAEQPKHKRCRNSSGAEVVTSRPIPQVVDGTRSGWVGRENSSIHINEAGYLSSPVTASDAISPAPSSSNQISKGRVQSVDPNSSQSSSSRDVNPSLLQKNPLDLGPEATCVPERDSSVVEDAGCIQQTITPSTITSTTREHDSNLSRKRPRTSNGPSPLEELTNDDEVTQRAGILDRKSTIRPSGDEYPESGGNNVPNGENSVPTPGYLSVRSGNRVRYVGSAFWGLVTGHVSFRIY